MNYYLATYIDFIQSIGQISIFALIFLLLRKLILDNNKDNYIEIVKVKVAE